MTSDAHALKIKNDPRAADFRLFLALHLLFWVLVPWLSRRILHYDSTEALAWGLTWEWGTNKHPPLSGWLAEGAVRLLGDPDLAVCILGQVCVVTAFIFIRRLALCFLDSEAAFFGTVFLEGTIYYNFSASQYNVNVLSLALVPAVTYFFWRAVQTGRLAFWLAAGLGGGLALLTKYTNVFPALALALFLLVSPLGRRRLRDSGPWLAALLAGLVFLPHFLWLVHYDFLPFRYSQEKAAETLGLAARFLEPLRLLLAQAGNAAATLGLWGYLYFRTPAADRGPRRWPEAFLLCAGLGPLLLLLVSMELLGLSGSTKWAYAFLGYVPLLLFFCLPAAPPAAVRRRALILTYLVLAAFGTGFAAKNLTVTRATTSVDGRGLAAALQAAWAEETGRPLRYVGGATHLVSRVSTYLPARPRPLWRLDPQVTPWEGTDKVKAAGALALAFSAREYEAYQARWPGLPPSRRLDWTFRAPLSRSAETLTIHYGLLQPARPEK